MFQGGRGRQWTKVWEEGRGIREQKSEKGTEDLQFYGSPQFYISGQLSTQMRSMHLRRARRQRIEESLQHTGNLAFLVAN